MKKILRDALRRLGAEERAQSIIEFAVALPFLVLMTVGTFAVGIILDRHLSLGQLVRNGGNMYARGVDFSVARQQNRQILIDAASGMSMSPTDNTVGDALVYLSLLTRVPADALCDGAPCANAGVIVLSQRHTIGKTAIANSKFDQGCPGYTLDADGNVVDFFDDSNAQVNSAMQTFLAGVLEDEIVYAVETFHKPMTIAFQGIFAPDVMYSRAFF